MVTSVTILIALTFSIDSHGLVNLTRLGKSANNRVNITPTDD